MMGWYRRQVLEVVAHLGDAQEGDAEAVKDSQDEGDGTAERLRHDAAVPEDDVVDMITDDQIRGDREAISRRSPSPSGKSVRGRRRSLSCPPRVDLTICVCVSWTLQTYEGESSDSKRWRHLGEMWRQFFVEGL
ncbi:hypothetical protein MLD38_017398 [Melastoma candidum]|uniref:Uncharacterized protein n=1 Tax=Melastoma candidum TaxID=119954 RepID=A0ACB9QSD8_9MYRT|nr:hypothetical protein MLD38_017398 [Melastoma candidum]